VCCVCTTVSVSCVAAQRRSTGDIWRRWPRTPCVVRYCLECRIRGGRLRTAVLHRDGLHEVESHCGRVRPKTPYLDGRRPPTANVNWLSTLASPSVRLSLSASLLRARRTGVSRRLSDAVRRFGDFRCASDTVDRGNSWGHVLPSVGPSPRGGRSDTCGEMTTTSGRWVTSSSTGPYSRFSQSSRAQHHWRDDSWNSNSKRLSGSLKTVTRSMERTQRRRLDDDASAMKSRRRLAR